MNDNEKKNISLIFKLKHYSLVSYTETKEKYAYESISWLYFMFNWNQWNPLPASSKRLLKEIWLSPLSGE